MNEESLSRILSRCLDRMAAGDTAAACLAQYPQHADELAPLLAAAVEMSGLRSYTMSTAGRQQMRVQILSAEVSRNQQQAASWWRWPAIPLGVPRLAAGLIVAVVCVVLSTAVVAASRPGDLGYGVRVAVERAPALLARDPEARARAELGVADRRLGDLDRTRSSDGGSFDKRAVAALLASAEHAADLAAELNDTQRAEVAARLLAQAAHLARLGDTAASSEDRATLQAAATEMRSAAERARGTSSPDEPPAFAPVATATPRPAPSATPTSVQPTRRAPAALPTRGAIAPSIAQSTHTAAPLRSGPNASATPNRTGSNAGATPKRTGLASTPKAPSPSASPAGPAPRTTPQGPGPRSTAQGPGPGATWQAPGPDNTPEGPGPDATPQGPGPGGTSEAPGATPQGPGGDAMPQGPGPDSTPQGPGPDPTAQGPGPAETLQGPGPGATPQSPGPAGTPGGPRP